MELAPAGRRRIQGINILSSFGGVPLRIRMAAASSVFVIASTIAYRQYVAPYESDARVLALSEAIARHQAAWNSWCNVEHYRTAYLKLCAEIDPTTWTTKTLKT